MNGAHKFGVEIEFLTRARSGQVIDAITATGLQASETDRLGSSPHWSVKYDGSLSGSGWEVVSPVLSGTDGLQQIATVCKALRTMEQHGFRHAPYISSSCGLHVHMSNFGSDTDILKSIARRWVNFEDTLDLLQPASRRDTRNSYCRSNRSLFGYDVQTSAEAAYERIGSADTLDSLLDVVSPTRYYKLNYQSLYRHGTIEFRHHAGTASATKIVNWVKFLSAFVDVAASSSRVWKRQPDVPAERFRKMMRGVPAGVQRYLRNRVATLNAGMQV